MSIQHSTSENIHFWILLMKRSFEEQNRIGRVSKRRKVLSKKNLDTNQKNKKKKKKKKVKRKRKNKSA